MLEKARASCMVLDWPFLKISVKMSIWTSQMGEAQDSLRGGPHMTLVHWLWL